MERGVEWEDRARNTIGGCTCSFENGFNWDGVHDKDSCIVFKVAKLAASAFKEGQRDGMERAAKIAITTKFSRICQDHGHNDGEIKWTFNGCKEIADDIHQALKKVENEKI